MSLKPVTDLEKPLNCVSTFSGEDHPYYFSLYTAIYETIYRY